MLTVLIKRGRDTPQAGAAVGCRSRHFALLSIVSLLARHLANTTQLELGGSSLAFRSLLMSAMYELALLKAPPTPYPFTPILHTLHVLLLLRAARRRGDAADHAAPESVPDGACGDERRCDVPDAERRADHRRYDSARARPAQPS